MAVQSITGTLTAGLNGSYKTVLSRNGRWLLSLTGGLGRVYQILSDGTFSAERTIPGTPSNMNGAAISNDGKFAIIAPYNSTSPTLIFVWGGSSYSLLGNLPASADGYKTALEINSAQNMIVAGAWGIIKTYSFDPSTGATAFLSSIASLGQLENVQISHAGTEIVGCGRNTNMTIYSVDGSGIMADVFSSTANGGWLASFSKDDLEIGVARTAVATGVSIFRKTAGTWGLLVSEAWSGVSAQEPGFVTIDAVDYMLVASGTAEIRAYLKSTDYSTFVASSTLGITATNSGVAALAFTGYDTNGDQYYGSVRQTSPEVMLWRIRESVPTLDITGDVTLPSITAEGLAYQLLGITGVGLVPQIVGAGSLEEQPGIYAAVILPFPQGIGFIGTPDPTVVAGLPIEFPSAYSIATPEPTSVAQEEQTPEFIGGVILLPHPGSAGSLVFQYEISGEALIPRVRSDGLLDEYHLEITGEATLPFLLTPGSLTTNSGLYGQALLPAIETSGELVQFLALSGGATIPTPGSSGDFFLENQIIADVTLPQLVALGYIQQDETPLVFGTIVLPGPAGEGILQNPLIVNGVATLPFVVAGGLFEATNLVDANVTLPRVRASGELKQVSRKRRNFNIIQPL